MEDLATTATTKPNIFKQCHNRHKRKPEAANRLDDLEELLDFHQHPHLHQKFAGFVRDIHCEDGQMFGLSCYPGFFFLPSILSAELQRDLGYKALTEYCESPHRTNIEAIPPKSSEVADGTTMWNAWGKVEEEHRRYRCFHKLSWATLGYFYDWTQRCYHKDQCSSFPPELTAIGRHFAQISQSLTHKDAPYAPSACIVNYYR